jgi:hypothetical protein
MREPLLTISVREFEGASGAELPVAVVNWNEIEDGNLEALLASKMFLDCVGIDLKNSTDAEGTGLLAAARSFFSWRDATDAERRGWQSAYEEVLREEGGEPPPFFIWDPRLLAH